MLRKELNRLLLKFRFLVRVRNQQANHSTYILFQSIYIDLLNVCQSIEKYMLS